MSKSGVPTEWFTRWWSPAEFFPMVQQHNEAIPNEQFFSCAEFQPLREAYAAGFFSWILGQERHVLVKLDADRFPDFDLKLDGVVVGFELVEADRPGRRRGDEYKEAARSEAASLPEIPEEFDPDEEQKAAIPVIRRVVELKAAKKYAPPPHLVVYVNFWLFDKPPLTPAQFGQLLQPWREAFPEVWLLWKAHAIRCWPDPIRLVGVPPGARP